MKPMNSSRMLSLFYQFKLKGNKSETVFENFYANVLKNIELKTRDGSSHKCRVCLREATVPILSLNNSKDILEVLNIFTGIQFNDEDEPKNLCTMCLKFINAGLLFRKTAHITERILRELVKEDTNSFNNLQDHDHDSDSSVNNDVNNFTKIETVEVIKKKKINETTDIIETPKVTCHICSKVVNRSYFKVHLTLHDPNHKKYVCDICGKSFRLRSSYHNHSQRHRTDFSFKCQICPYKARYLELLKTHMRTHSGDYRYMCTECPARFLFKSNLNSHMLKHKDPKFKCDGCKRAFHSKLMLQRHFEADHLGIKNHICSMCGKVFGYRNAMMKHQRGVHKRQKLKYGRMPAYLQAQTQNFANQ